jgi:hypothetical protein
MTVQQIGIKPLIGTALWKNGVVVAHERVIDSLGRWHGLIRLVVDGFGNMPDQVNWQKMLLVGANVKAIMQDEEITSKIIILYKLEEQ